MARLEAAEPSLRRRLLVWLLGPLLALLALDAALGWWAALHAADVAQARTLHEIARELALHVEPGPQGPRLQLTPAAERLLLQDADDQRFFRIVTAGGASVGGDQGLLLPQLAAPPAEPRAYDATLHGHPVRVAAAWIAAGDEAGSEPLLVLVAETLNQRNALAREILAQQLLPQLLVLLLAPALVVLAISRGLAPLQRLREALASRSHRDLRPLDALHAPAEVRPLVEEVNLLMARLGQALDLQRRFIADAAHQLKTPVSGLKAQIELGLRESEPQRLQDTMARLLQGVDRLSRLVRQLLSLARNEPGAVESLRMQPLDLAALALEVSMEWAPQALRRRIDLGFEGGAQPLRITADVERLRELLNNLVDNAIRYSQEGGRVTVDVAAAEDGQVCLSVHDDGPRIPADERSRIFERFHRLLGAPAEGSGLGLAIVSEIATLHGARITLEEDSDGVGNRFSVWFRAA